MIRFVAIHSAETHYGVTRFGATHCAVIHSLVVDRYAAADHCAAVDPIVAVETIWAPRIVVQIWAPIVVVVVISAQTVPAVHNAESVFQSVAPGVVVLHVVPTEAAQNVVAPRVVRIAAVPRAVLNEVVPCAVQPVDVGWVRTRSPVDRGIAFQLLQASRDGRFARGAKKDRVAQLLPMVAVRLLGFGLALILGIPGIHGNPRDFRDLRILWNLRVPGLALSDSAQPPGPAHFSVRCYSPRREFALVV